MDDPDDPTRLGKSLFVDRVSESEALRTTLLKHRARVDVNDIDPKALRNVLMFFGDGGVGKTELSEQLEGWIMGNPRRVEHWGNAPETSVDAKVRWELNDSHGGLDPLALLTNLRNQLGSIQTAWPAFDLAFGALHRALRPGIELRLRTPKSGSTTFSEVLAGLTGDVLGEAGVAASGGFGAAAFSLLRFLRSTVKGMAALKQFPSLEQLIADCESASGSLEETSRLAGRVAFMLTLEFEKMQRDRPMVVVFVDHMERLQVAGQGHLGEATLNRLIARLPYFLFVITGRRSLRWHERSTELPESGVRTWPLLSTEDPPADEPRQHKIGYLAEPDAQQFLRSSFEFHGISVERGLVEHLAKVTGGWPLHLHTIVGVASERATRDQALTADDLGGGFPELVDRLLSDLPADIAEAFRAACLLPYFDEPFAAAAGEVRSGAVEQLLKRTQLVLQNKGSAYPYRIHDTLRLVVRQAGSDAMGGWGAADWERHARLALAEAQRRFTNALAEDEDPVAIQSLALGLNVASEHSVFESWLVDAIRSSPSIQGLAPLIAANPEDGAPEDLIDMFDFLRLRVNAAIDDVTDELNDIVNRRTAISSTAGVWRAYDLRNRGKIDQTLTQFETLLRDFNDRPDLYRNQIVTTLRLDRRYQDALQRSGELLDTQVRMQRSAIDRAHGKFDGASQTFEQRVREATSRRFQVELSGDLLLMRHREHGVTEQEAQAVYTTALAAGHPLAQVDSLSVIA